MFYSRAELYDHIINLLDPVHGSTQVCGQSVLGITLLMGAPSTLGPYSSVSLLTCISLKALPQALQRKGIAIVFWPSRSFIFSLSFLASAYQREEHNWYQLSAFLGADVERWYVGPKGLINLWGHVVAWYPSQPDQEPTVAVLSNM